MTGTVTPRGFCQYIAAPLLAALGVIALAVVVPAAENTDSDQQVLHVLNRIGFGPTTADLAHVKQIGIERYIDEQLNPERLPEPAALTERLAKLDTLSLDASQLYAEYGPTQAEMTSGATQEAVDARIKRATDILRQARVARLYRALYSPRQLQEVMVDFWFNHFNVNAFDGFDLLWIGNYETAAIRPHVLGHFRDLLLATSQHPAMLYYLDNQSSTMPGIPQAGPGFAGLNENYARELMELHTLGADGGYTQQDVETLARILTGWGFDYNSLKAGSGSGFGFDAWRHDASEKMFLGHRIPAGGEEQGIAALDILATSPATAHHISYELAQYFVADDPPSALVDRLAQRFLESDGDIKAVLQTLLTSAEFRDSVGDKYKTPYQYVLSSLRATGSRFRSPTPFLGMMEQLGMPLYLCETPDGYKNTKAAWLSPDGTTQRTNFAVLMGSGALQAYVPPDEAPALHLVAAPGGQDASKPEPVDATALEALLGPTLSDHARAVIAQSPPALQAGLMLGSPDFMRK
jgi:uncharacterized protein (DUF1800 family)